MKGHNLRSVALALAGLARGLFRQFTLEGFSTRTTRATRRSFIACCSTSTIASCRSIA
jgi:hypothetical protein